MPAASWRPRTFAAHLSPVARGGKLISILPLATWLDGLSLIKAAKNLDQVYAFLEYLQTPEASAAVAEGSGYNPVVTGADALLSDQAKKNFQEAYPGDALKNLWHRPPEPSWFGELRTQYADKLKSA